jgi:hypothetical protein
MNGVSGVEAAQARGAIQAREAVQASGMKVYRVKVCRAKVPGRIEDQRTGTSRAQTWGANSGIMVGPDRARDISRQGRPTVGIGRNDNTQINVAKRSDRVVRNGRSA